MAMVIDYSHFSSFQFSNLKIKNKIYQLINIHKLESLIFNNSLQISLISIIKGKSDNNGIPNEEGLPAELLNELFGSLPLKNAFVLLTKMANGLLVKNVQKMINGIKEAMKNNKLNTEDCGSGLAISHDELVAKHSGPNEYNCIRAVSPIPTLNLKINKPGIVFYFEVQILTTVNGSINIGFSDQLFPLERKWLGYVKNSIGIDHYREIYIDKCGTKFGNGTGDFNKEDVIGLGIIQQPNSKLECFATSNGKLLGKKELLSKFANFQLFPTVDLYYTGDSVHVNFGKEEWQFKELQSVLH